MHAPQGTKSITVFAKEIEELATQCQFTGRQYTKERAVKDAIIFGMSDERLQQEALAKDLDYLALIVTAVKYIVYSFRSTRETLDTALFTIRKFVFTVTLIHESS